MTRFRIRREVVSSLSASLGVSGGDTEETKRAVGIPNNSGVSGQCVIGPETQKSGLGGHLSLNRVAVEFPMWPSEVSSTVFFLEL